MSTYRVKWGVHSIKDKIYKPGDLIESDNPKFATGTNAKFFESFAPPPVGKEGAEKTLVAAEKTAEEKAAAKAAKAEAKAKKAAAEKAAAEGEDAAK